MENNQSFEEKIRVELKLKGNELEPSDELYSEIMAHISYKKRGSFTMFKKNIFNWSTKKTAAAFICLTIMLVGVSFGTSRSLRTFATDTFNYIKTIFILDDSNKIVEKPVSKVPLVFTSGKDTNLNDVELSKKIGFQLSFPSTLSNGMKLDRKEEIITLGNIDYNTAVSLSRDAEKAIDDDVVFKNLASYKPFRGACATYSKDKVSVAINAVPDFTDLEKTMKNMNAVKTDINGIKGYWVELSLPIYPVLINDGMAFQDMGQKPTDIKISHQLTWFSNGIYYSIIPLHDQNVSMDQAKEIAKSFIAANIN